MCQPQPTQRPDHVRVVPLPAIRGLLGHAALTLTETTFAPGGLFWLLLHTAGLRAAIAGGLAFNYLLIARRLCRRQRVPSLLLLGAGLLTVRSVVAFATGSAFVYFLQPAADAFLLAAVFGGSAVAGRPLLRRLAGDFLELPAVLARSAAVAVFFRQVTLLWALVNVVDGALAVHVLLAHSVDMVLLVRSVVSPALTVSAVAVSVCWGRMSLRRAGLVLRLRWTDPADAGPVAPVPVPA